MGMLDGVQVGIEVRDGIVVPVRHGVFLEELETVVIADLLAGVDQGLAAWQGPAENGHCLPGISHPLEFGSVPGILIMVGGEHQPVGIAIPFFVPFQVLEKAVSIRLALGYVIEQMMEPPGIGTVESCIIEPGLLPLCKEEQPSGIFIPEFRKHSGPEVLRDLGRHVATEAVDPSVQPETHAFLHFGTHVLAAVIELCYVRPVIFNDCLAVSITDIPVGSLFRHPRMIRRGVVRNPVDNHLEA